MAKGPVRAWSISSQSSDLSGLVFKDTKTEEKLRDDEVLVELRAASLNYRDLMAAKGLGGVTAAPGVIPGSDGAGVVLNVGSQVRSFKPGDRVVTHMLPKTFANQSLGVLDDDMFPTMGHVFAGLGQDLNGTLTTHGVFRDSCLAKFGEGLSFEQAATLTCSGITAWNALMGLEGHKAKKGDWVLVQGTGGVSIAAMQLSLAAGATVVATTSSDEKAAQLLELGAKHTINYRKVPEWGSSAKILTPSGRGFDIIVDVGGNATLGQSIQAARINGLVAVAGVVGKSDSKPESLISVLWAVCTVRGIVLGTRQMMKDMIAFMTERGVKPALDGEVFALSEAKEAFRKIEEQRHFSKVVVQIPGAMSK